ncbi:hypothetical protein FKP32DRAFT_1269373 [Trametes sanguinea]|nr:hypothetical protein FKP32DRAFT_1269373 [Trametes sanguinea]
MKVAPLQFGMRCHPRSLVPPTLRGLEVSIVSHGDMCGLRVGFARRSEVCRWQRNAAQYVPLHLPLSGSPASQSQCAHTSSLLPPRFRISTTSVAGTESSRSFARGFLRYDWDMCSHYGRDPAASEALRIGVVLPVTKSRTCVFEAYHPLLSATQAHLPGR